MAHGLLEGLRVLDLGGDTSARGTRCSATWAPTSCGSSRRAAIRSPTPYARAWNAGKQVVRLAAGDHELETLLAEADVVFDEPGEPGAHDLDPARCAPQAVWVRITPFGAEGPRSTWRASDLGVMAASGNMYCTGDPDRAPIRSTEPTGYAHSGPEAAFAAMTALASGLPAARRLLDAGGRADRQHGRARPLPPTPSCGAAAGAPTSAAPVRSGRRSTASCRSVCAAARRASRASRSSRSSSRATASTPTRSSTATGTSSTRTPRPTRTSPRSRSRSPSTSPATPCRSCTTSRARPT